MNILVKSILTNKCRYIGIVLNVPTKTPILNEEDSTTKKRTHLSKRPVFLTKPNQPQSKRINIEATTPNLYRCNSKNSTRVITQRTTETQTLSTDLPQTSASRRLSVNYQVNQTKNIIKANTSIKRRTPSPTRDTNSLLAGELKLNKGLNNCPEKEDKKGNSYCSIEQQNIQSISNQYHLRNFKTSSSYDKECLSDFNHLINEIVDYEIVSSPTTLLSPKTELSDFDDLLNFEESTNNFDDTSEDIKSEIYKISTDPENILAYIKELEDNSNMDYTSNIEFLQTSQSPEFNTDIDLMHCMNPMSVFDNTFDGDFDYLNNCPLENSIDLSTVNMEEKVSSMPSYINSSSLYDTTIASSLTDSLLPIFCDDFMPQQMPAVDNSSTTVTTTQQSTANVVDPTNVSAEEFDLLNFINNDRIVNISDMSSLNDVLYDDVMGTINADHIQRNTNILEDTSSYISLTNNHSNNINNDNGEITIQYSNISNDDITVLSSLPPTNSNMLLLDLNKEPSILVQDSSVFTTLNTPDITNEILSLDPQVTYNLVPFNASFEVSILRLFILFIFIKFKSYLLE